MDNQRINNFYDSFREVILKYKFTYFFIFVWDRPELAGKKLAKTFLENDSCEFDINVVTILT